MSFIIASVLLIIFIVTILFLYIIPTYTFMSKTRDMQHIYVGLNFFYETIKSMSLQEENVLEIKCKHNIYTIRFSSYEDLLDKFEKFVQDLINYYEKQKWMQKKPKLVECKNALSTIIINIRKEKMTYQ